MPAQIYYNPSVDMLYFPAWCFEINISSLQNEVPAAHKDTIPRNAIDALIWYKDSEDGVINSQIQISEFKNLNEFLMVTRLPSKSGCFHRFDGPEKGVPAVVEQEVREVAMEKGEEGQNYYGNCAKDVLAEFERIREGDKQWKKPEFRFVQLTRDGVLK